MTIQKTTVTHVLIDPSGGLIQANGVISLGGFIGNKWVPITGIAADGQIVSWVDAPSDGTGSWSVQLIPNIDITSPVNTLYRYETIFGQPLIFEVPNGGVTAKLDTLLVSDPAQWGVLQLVQPGPAGPANTLTIGTVSSGTVSSATITGTSPNQTLSLVLEQGDPGVPGPANSLAIGTVGSGISAAATITGTAPAQTLNLTLPKGDPGSPGVAATIAVGTTTTGAPGTSAIVTNSGTSGAAVFDFTIPTGADGNGSVDTVNGIAPVGGNVTLAKADIALGNVDNTADATKNVLTATKLTTARTINGVAFDGTTNIAVVDATKVPITRTINGKALNADIALTAVDVNALQTVVAGANITVDTTDPHNPVIASTGGMAGTYTIPDATDASQDYIAATISDTPRRLEPALVWAIVNAASGAASKDKTASLLTANGQATGTVVVPRVGFDFAGMTETAQAFYTAAPGWTSLRSLSIRNTSSVTNASGMFSGCVALVDAPLIDTSSVSNMGSMFANCSLLASIPPIDTSSATDMNNMFLNCASLSLLPPLATSLVTNMSNMFSGCSTLDYVELTNCAAVTNAAGMFTGCVDLMACVLTGLKVSVNVSGTAMGASAIDGLFRSLGTATAQTVTVPAAVTGYDATIATAKGWTVATA